MSRTAGARDAPGKKVLFVGSKALGLAVLGAMHAVAPDALLAAAIYRDTDDPRSVIPAFRAFGESKNIPVRDVGGQRELTDLVTELKPDLCLVSGWYHLIDTALIEAVPMGFIGLHNSLLPAYRGAAPLVWALINREPEVGFSLFSLTEGMDDGPVWAQRRVAVGPSDDIGTILTTFESLAVHTVAEMLPGILDGSLGPVEQDHRAATYCAMRTESDGQIDWTAPAAQVCAFIRAQTAPYPGAFSVWNGEKIRFWRARIAPMVYHGTAGQVARFDGARAYINCGASTAIMVDEVETAGGLLPARRVLASLKTRLHPPSPLRTG